MEKGQAGLIIIAVVVVLAIIIFMFSSSGPTTTFPTGGIGGKGSALNIEQLRFKPEVFSGESIVIEVKIKNRGIYDAKNVVLNLLGLTDEWKIDGEPLTSNHPKRTVSFPTLLGDPKLNGEEQIAIWQLTVPNKVTTLTYPFTIKLNYDYKSRYEALVRTVSPTFREKGRLLDQKITPGPIVVSLKSDEWRVIGTFTSVELTITNSGGGEVVDRIITLKNLKNIECPQTTLTFSTKDSQIEKEITTTCKILTGSVQEFNDIEISFDLEYRYSIKQDKSIKVKPLA